MVRISQSTQPWASLMCSQLAFVELDYTEANVEKES